MSLSSSCFNKHELHQSITDATDYSILNLCASQPEKHHWQRTCSSYIWNYLALYCNIQRDIVLNRR